MEIPPLGSICFLFFCFFLLVSFFFHSVLDFLLPLCSSFFSFFFASFVVSPFSYFLLVPLVLSFCLSCSNGVEMRRRGGTNITKLIRVESRSQFSIRTISFSFFFSFFIRMEHTEICLDCDAFSPLYSLYFNCFDVDNVSM